MGAQVMTQIDGENGSSSSPAPRFLSREMSAGSHGAEKLLDGRAFRAAVDHAMLRADQTNSPMILLILNVADEIKPTGRRDALQNLAEVVVVSSRKTDSVGWYQDGSGELSVGLILGDAREERARNVTEEVRRNFASREAGFVSSPAPLGPEITCEVFDYPGEVQLEEIRPQESKQLWWCPGEAPNA